MGSNAMGKHLPLLGALFVVLVNARMTIGIDSGAAGGEVPLGAGGTHLAPPDNPRHESVEETAARAHAMAEHAGSIGDHIAHVEKAIMVSGFVPAFVASLVMIILSEIGDKTFFIAAILA